MDPSSRAAEDGQMKRRGMVGDRIAIIRRLFDAWAAARLDSLLHHVDPAVEVDWSDSVAPYRGVYRGHDGWVELFGEIRHTFGEVASEPHDFVVAGQHVAVPNTARMRGRDGVDVVARSTLVFTFTGVKLVAVRVFQREDDALAAIRPTAPPAPRGRPTRGRARPVRAAAPCVD